MLFFFIVVSIFLEFLRTLFVVRFYFYSSCSTICAFNSSNRGNFPVHFSRGREAIIVQETIFIFFRGWIIDR